MSRQSKNAKRLAKAREVSKMRKEGGRGPAKTEPKHGKRWTYRHNPSIQKALAEAVKALSSTKQDRTSGAAILAMAGGASADQD